MERRSSLVSLVAFLFLLSLVMSCGSADPAPVRVIGGPEDLAPLTGEWVGTYEGRSGRTGSITFHLTDDPKGAHGDVVFLPQKEITYGGDPRAHEPFAGATVLSIEFVRVSAGEITGKIASYPDPEVAEATLETHFAGHLAGDRIDGTFVTYSDHGVAPRRGTWSVHRKPPAR